MLSRQPDGWQLGHGVLVGNGMVAWIAAWTTFTPPAAAAGTSAPDPSTAPTTPSLSTTTSTVTPHPSALSSLPCAAQLVAVLTQMALAHA